MVNIQCFRLIYSSVFPSKKRRQGQSQSGDRDTGRELRTGSCTELKFQMKIDQSQILSMQCEKVYILSVPGTALNSQNIPAETVNFNQGQRVQNKLILMGKEI